MICGEAVVPCWCVCSNKFKLVILDECDAMTRDAQFALRRGEYLPGMLAVSRGYSSSMHDTGGITFVDVLTVA